MDSATWYLFTALSRALAGLCLPLEKFNQLVLFLLFSLCARNVRGDLDFLCISRLVGPGMQMERIKLFKVHHFWEKEKNYEKRYASLLMIVEQ